MKYLIIKGDSSLGLKKNQYGVIPANAITEYMVLAIFFSLADATEYAAWKEGQRGAQG